jgi:hypothetical protein
MYRYPFSFTLPATLLLCAATGAAQSSTVNVQVSNQINRSAGVNGRLQVAMSTSLQLDSGTYQFFQPNARSPSDTERASAPAHTSAIGS